MDVVLSKRLLGWGIAAAATGGGAFLWTAAPDGPASAPVQPATTFQDAKAPAPAKENLAELLANARRDPLGRKAGELFSTPAAVPRGAAAAPAAAAPVTRNSVPPFPFKYSGWLRGSGLKEIYLERGGRMISVKAGDVLDGFRIDAIGNERMEVTYLSGGQRLSLAFAELNAAQDLPGAAAEASSALTARASDSNSFAMAGGFAAAPALSQRAGGRASSGASGGGPASSANAQPSAPSSGSMPTAVAPRSAMPIGVAVDPASRGRLGSDPASSGNRGL